MSEKFYSLLTNIGKAKIANSVGLGTKINFVTMKVGDGGGAYYEPTEDQIDLKNTVWSGNINHVEIDTENPSWINIEVMIPSTVGGFTIREYGAFDEEGNMLGICKTAESYKPVIADGSTKELLLTLVLAVSNTESVTLKIDPTIIFAKKSEVEQLRTDITAQLSDLVYQIAGGTGTVITLTMQTLVTGYAKTFIASASNGGAATTINGKPVYKPGTTTPPNFAKDKAYTVWYNLTGDCFFIKASAEGNTIPSHVLAGDTFSNDNDTDLLGTLDLSLLVSGNIRAGITINGITGVTNVVDTTISSNVATSAMIRSGYKCFINGVLTTGTATEKATATITPGTIDQTIPSGVITTGVQTIKGDANLVAANIKSGINIFNTVGTYDPITLIPGTTTILAQPGGTFEATSINPTRVSGNYTVNGKGGIVRTSFKLASGSNGYTAYCQVFVNGVARGILRSTASYQIYTTFVEDISVNIGDIIAFYAYSSYAGKFTEGGEIKIMVGNVIPSLVAS